MPNSKKLALKVRGLHKQYAPASKNEEGKIALKSVDLDIPKGSFFGLLGPNGAGKSTFINTLASLVNKTSGTAEISGYDIDHATSDARRAIGVVPQELILDPFFNIFETLEQTAGYYGVPKKERRTMEIIKALGLEDKAFVHPRSLSGGMKRRLLIGKALVHSPDVLVLDEPTAGVDVELRTQLWEYVKLLNKQGTTIVLTTHYLEEAQELCDHIAVINNGEIIVNDTKRKVMKMIDRKKITITANKKLKTIPKQMNAHDASINEDGEIEINYKAADLTIEKILNDFSKTDYKIKDLSTEEADLEEVFKHLTAK